jgi:hypothetical protein
MTETIIILLAGIFLPIFPMSMVLNAIIENIRHAWFRVFIFIAWPLCGLFIVIESGVILPDWLILLALVTSFLYALRILTLRDVDQWCGFLATSFWSLLWLAVLQEYQAKLLYGFAFGMSAPLVLLVLLSKGLEQRFGAAYMGLYGGLARTIPRYSGILVLVVVAATATPLFPTFFIMFDLIVKTVSSTPYVAIVLLLIWLLWSWAGARLIQGLIVGRASDIKVADMGMSVISLYTIVLFTLIAAGVYLGGMIL